MKTIHAVYQNGVFQPTEPVELPEGTPVVVAAGADEAGSVQAARGRVLDSLSRSYEGGEFEDSAKHGEHQP
jgi:predicted DNA-binding antitoxin AbrB/MazE fold protein